MGLMDEVVEIVINENGKPSLTLTASSTRGPAEGARRGVQQGSCSCGQSDYASELLGRRKSRVVPWPVCDFDANGLAVNDRKALAERFIT